MKRLWALILTAALLMTLPILSSAEELTGMNATEIVARM